MSGWLENEVIAQRRWSEALFSLTASGPRPAFEAGQFVKIALDLRGERVGRPFSFVNPPSERTSEFYGVIVPQGALSPSLAALRPGDKLYLADLASGFLVLSEVPAAPVLWMVSTGTGLAPFLSILQDDAVWRRYAAVVLVHAARRTLDLTYRPLIVRLLQAHGARLSYVTLVSRERPALAQPGAALEGRIPAAIRDGRLEAAAGRALNAQEAQVMLCGNPDMIHDATLALGERGMKKHRRRSPGHITVERFW